MGGSLCATGPCANPAHNEVVGSSQACALDETSGSTWLAEVVVDTRDDDLRGVLQTLRFAADLNQRGRIDEANSKFGEAKATLEQLEVVPALNRSESSLRKIRAACSSDPDLAAIAAREKRDPASEELQDAGRNSARFSLNKEGGEFSLDDAPSRPSIGDGTRMDKNVLQEQFDTLNKLCIEGRVFDAAAAFDELQATLEIAAGNQQSEEVSDLIQEVSRRLKTDNIYLVLNATHSRMKLVLATMGPSALPGGDKDTRWVQTIITDPLIGSEFKADIRMRFMDSNERDPNGPSTQLIVCGQLYRFPTELARFVSVYRETDLYKKEWIADCAECGGDVGGADRFYSALSRIINASPLLPFNLEVLTVREFAVCDKAPLDGRRAGVLIMDQSPPPDELKEFAGWPLPPGPKKSVRLSGVGLILYFVPNETRPDWCDVFAFSRLGAPVPQWLLPLSLLKRFLANHFLSVFKAIKQNIIDDWDNLNYGDRIQGQADFYGAIKKMHMRASMREGGNPQTAQ